MDSLGEAVGILAEGGLLVSPYKLSIIRGVDQAVSGTVDGLRQRLYDLEEANRDQWSMGYLTLEDDLIGSVYGRVESARVYDPQALQNLVFLRCAAVVDCLPRILTCTVESGGVKSFGRTDEKVARMMEEFGEANIPDLTRFRVITDGLVDLEVAVNAVRADYDMRLLSGNNYYAGRGARRKYGTPWRGINTVWGGFEWTAQEGCDAVTTEVQFISRRVWAVSEIDHPFNVAKVVEYPSEELRQYIRSLMLKASILDFEEAFGKLE